MLGHWRNFQRLKLNLKEEQLSALSVLRQCQKRKVGFRSVQICLTTLLSLCLNSDYFICALNKEVLGLCKGLAKYKTEKDAGGTKSGFKCVWGNLWLHGSPKVSAREETTESSALPLWNRNVWEGFLDFTELSCASGNPLQWCLLLEWKLSKIFSTETLINLRA